jgi:hypothetical protein
VPEQLAAKQKAAAGNLRNSTREHITEQKAAANDTAPDVRNIDGAACNKTSGSLRSKKDCPSSLLPNRRQLQAPEVRNSVRVAYY